MKNTRIIAVGIGRISDSVLERFDRIEERLDEGRVKLAKRKDIRKYAILAACLALMAITVPITVMLLKNVGGFMMPDESDIPPLQSGNESSSLPPDYSSPHTEGLTFELDGDGYTVIGYVGDDAEVIVPEIYKGLTVKAIGDNAFKGISTVESVSLPDSVSYIGSGAFRDCESLRSASLGNGITVIGYSAFRGCVSLETVTLGGSLTKIANTTFDGCASLRSIALPDSVTEIGEGAFHGCGLESVRLPSGLKTIGNEAFSDCTALLEAAIPDCVESVGMGAFRGCKSLESISVPFVGSGAENSENSYFGYIFGAESYGNNGTKVPRSLKNVTVTNSDRIWQRAFDGCVNIVSVKISESVKSIGNYAFYGCHSLAELRLEEGLESIGNYAFFGCKSLLSVVIPDGVTALGLGAFIYCESLTSVSLPGSLETVSESAFTACYSLKSLNIAEGVREIGKSAFYSCEKLESVIIPEGVETVGEDAFGGCFELTSVELPKSLERIGDEAFRNAGNKKNVKTSYHFSGTTSEWEAIDKGDNWNDSTNGHTVVCSDGEV